MAEGKTNELMDDVNMAIKCLIWKLAEPSLLQYKGSDIILQKQLQNKESRQVLLNTEICKKNIKQKISCAIKIVALILDSKNYIILSSRQGFSQVFFLFFINHNQAMLNEIPDLFFGFAFF